MTGPVPSSAPSLVPAPIRDGWEYGVDAMQRTLLFWEVLRRRGQQYLDHNEAENPPVLEFEYEKVVNGMDLPRPTSYQLLRIVPPAGMEIDERKRPFVIIDPRAGQGPGIGGSQTDSQVGVALRAGHPCYFVAFKPMPAPSQTIEDITAAETEFLREIRRRHPDAAGDPVLIGNCQAGWATVLLSGAEPDLVGPLVLAGTPLSYWDGPKGQSPMRYFGGLMGGTWLGELASDLGNGRFDGAYLVQNFESLNPANTLLKKPYRVYAGVDTEAERFLRFEKWWGGFFLMNAEEIRFISNELFVGNKLSRGELRTPHGHRLDLRNIRSPIVVLTSHGDNIAPPPQALNWILDLYGSVEDIRNAEQTIVYCIHPDVGHLGIFVSGRLAEREHAEFIENIDLVELLPPGLYEAVITERPSVSGPVEDRYVTRFVARTLDDLRKAAGGRSPENTARFAAVARLSEVNRGLYQQFVQPWVRAVANERTAEAIRQAQPARLRYTLWTDHNPWFRVMSKALELTAEMVRQRRRPVRPDNPFWRAQQQWADACVRSVDALRELRDRTWETWFDAVYGSPMVQAMAELAAQPAQETPSREYVFAHLADRRRSHHDQIIDQGGLPEAILRAAMYVVMADHTISDVAFMTFERAFASLADDAEPAELPELRTMVREQHALLLDRPGEAIAALPAMLERRPDRERALAIVHEVVHAAGPLDPRRAARLEEIARVLGVEPQPTPEPASA
mgnify:CR=1 FL=1